LHCLNSLQQPGGVAGFKDFHQHSKEITFGCSQKHVVVFNLCAGHFAHISATTTGPSFTCHWRIYPTHDP
jgi:hypothetical protein